MTAQVPSPVSVVITSYNQPDQLLEAVRSALDQTLPPERVIVVDDGSQDPAVPAALAEATQLGAAVLRQPNAGVSAARNRGITAADTPYVAVLDGDDRLRPTFVQEAVTRLEEDGDVVAVSSWMQMFGVADAVVRPAGGTLVDFLAHNACPANAVLRRMRWEQVGGYDDHLRAGFEDWDFYLSALALGGRIEVVPQTLLEYRTHPASANVASARSRLALLTALIDKHHATYAQHWRQALLAVEATSIARLDRWEQLMEADPALAVGEVSFGDGGMAAAVRIASSRSQVARR